MKVRQDKIIQAYELTDELKSKKDISVSVKWMLYQLRSALRPHCEFFAETEEEIKEKYREKADENGKIYKEDAFNYQTEMNELYTMEKDIQLDKLKIKLSDCGDISVEEMEKLDSFIEFEME